MIRDRGKKPLMDFLIVGAEKKAGCRSTQGLSKNVLSQKRMSYIKFRSAIDNEGLYLSCSHLLSEIKK